MYNQFNSQQQSTWISIKLESLRSKPGPLQLARNNQASHGGATITLSSCRCQWPNFCKAELARSGTPQGLYHCSCLSACIYNCTVFLLLISSISLDDFQYFSPQWDNTGFIGVLAPLRVQWLLPPIAMPWSWSVGKQVVAEAEAEHLLPFPETS